MSPLEADRPDEPRGCRCGAALATPPANTLTRGAYTIWTADRDGNMIDPPPDPAARDRDPNPALDEAVDIYFVLEESPSAPPEEQIELQLSIDRVLRVLRTLYLDGTRPHRNKFRPYYVRLFRIAQLGLEGPHAACAIAKGALAALTGELIDEEAAPIKNAYLVRLGKWTLLFSGVCVLVYATIWLAPTSGLLRTLRTLQIDPPLLAAFCILFVGCFSGVWLSYGIRKSTFTLADLTRAEDDLLTPPMRLLFAGALTTVLGLLFALKFIEFRIGDVSLTALAASPMTALLVGLFCGISELVLPASIGARAKAFVDNVK